MRKMISDMDAMVKKIEKCNNAVNEESKRKGIPIDPKKDVVHQLISGKCCLENIY